MTPRTLAAALVVSLTLNVFVVAAVGGAVVMRHHRMAEERARSPKMGNPIMRIAERLPEDVRARYMARLRQDGAAVRPRMKAARAARAEAAKALAADPYDPSAVTAALDRARSEEAATRATLENTVVDFARDLKPEERALIAQALWEPHGRRHGGREGFDRDRKPDAATPKG